MISGFLYGLGFSLGMGVGLIILLTLVIYVYFRHDWKVKWSDTMTFREYLAEKRNA